MHKYKMYAERTGRANADMSKRDKNCQVPTPVSVVRLMLDSIDYKHNLWGRRVLENSCGEGNILIEIVKRYIADARENQYTPEKISQGLCNDIAAYEIDQNKIDKCVMRLNDLISSEGLPGVRWNIRHQDFLKSEENNVEFIIGNPPYITYHDLSREEREFLQKNFAVCKKGRFDYCYAFIEASVKALADHGKMIYLVPFSIFRNRFAAGLRAFLRNYIVGIMDFSGIPVFPGITCSTSLILCRKGYITDEIKYKDIMTQNQIFLNRSTLKEDGQKWVFQKTNGEGKRFGDYFSVHNSIATLYNKAFLFSAEEENEKYYLISGTAVEKSVTLPAVSTKSCKAMENKGRRDRIIFPYNREKDKVVHYSAEEFRNQYPCAWNYLNQFQDSLEKRQADEKAEWFEYGRSQALAEIFEEKLVMPMVITDSTKVYIAGRDTVPYAGYFVKVNSDSNLTLEDAKKILESAQFYRYVKEVGTPTTVSSYRVSVHDISEFIF